MGVRGSPDEAKGSCLALGDPRTPDPRWVGGFFVWEPILSDMRGGKGRVGVRIGSGEAINTERSYRSVFIR